VRCCLPEYVVHQLKMEGCIVIMYKLNHVTYRCFLKTEYCEGVVLYAGLPYIQVNTVIILP